MDEDNLSYMRSFGFEPLGFAQARGGEPRYIFRCATGMDHSQRALIWRPPGGLLALNPDAGFWRKLIPETRRADRHRRGGGHVDP